MADQAGRGDLVPEGHRERLLVHHPAQFDDRRGHVRRRGEDGVGQRPGPRRQPAGRWPVGNAEQLALDQRGPLVPDEVRDD